jgi:hypothetical protein
VERSGREVEDEKPGPLDATPLTEELGAADIPEGELGGESAAGPMVGSFATTGAIQLIQAVVGVLLARILGPSDRGELAAVILWPTLMTTIGSIGLAQAATYHASRTSRLGVVVGSALAIVAVDSVLLVAIGWTILPLVLGGHDSGVVHEAQLFLTGFVPLNLLAVSMMSILNGSHRFAWFQSLRLIMIGSTAIGIGLLLRRARLPGRLRDLRRRCTRGHDPVRGSGAGGLQSRNVPGPARVRLQEHAQPEHVDAQRAGRPARHFGLLQRHQPRPLRGRGDPDLADHLDRFLLCPGRAADDRAPESAF